MWKGQLQEGQTSQDGGSRVRKWRRPACQSQGGGHKWQWLRVGHQDKVQSLSALLSTLGGTERDLQDVQAWKPGFQWTARIRETRKLNYWIPGARKDCEPEASWEQAQEESSLGAGSLAEPGTEGKWRQDTAVAAARNKRLCCWPRERHFRTSHSFLLSLQTYADALQGSIQGLSSDAIQPERNSASARWRQLAGHLYPPTSSSWTHSPRHSLSQPLLL